MFYKDFRREHHHFSYACLKCRHQISLTILGHYALKGLIYYWYINKKSTIIRYILTITPHCGNIEIPVDTVDIRIHVDTVEGYDQLCACFDRSGLKLTMMSPFLNFL